MLSCFYTFWFLKPKGCPVSWGSWYAQKAQGGSQEQSFSNIISKEVMVPSYDPKTVNDKMKRRMFQHESYGPMRNV